MTKKPSQDIVPANQKGGSSDIAPVKAKKAFPNIDQVMGEESSAASALNMPMGKWIDKRASGEPEHRIVSQNEATAREWGDDFKRSYNNHVLNKADENQGKPLNKDDFDLLPYDLTYLDLSDAEVDGADMIGRDFSNSILDEQFLKSTKHLSGAKFDGVRIRRGNGLVPVKESRSIIDNILHDHGIKSAVGLEDKSNYKRVIAVSAAAISLVGATGVAITILPNFGKAADGGNGLSEAETKIACSNDDVHKIPEVADICKAHGYEMPEA